MKIPHHFLLILPAFVFCFFCHGIVRSDDWPALERQFDKAPRSCNSRPLWFWNKVPTKEETREQMKACAEKGYAGLAILPAFSQDDMKFMSPEFLEQYKAAADAAREFGLKLCLYDEYWFPSGSAGGLLREQHPEHLCKRLDMVQADTDAAGKAELKIPDGVLMGCVAMNRTTFDRKNVTDRVRNGVLQWQRPEGDKNPYKIMAFVCVTDGQRNLVDYLEPASMQAFVELTYAAYQRAMPEHFGTTIDSAFYDEPMLYTPGDGRAWTPKFNEYFEKRFGYDPVPLYPALFMTVDPEEGGPETGAARNALFGFRATLFSEGFVKTITDWLKPYGMPLTGHLDQEEVVNPVGVTGDAIKFFEFQPIPGLDQIFQYGRGSCMYKLISSAAVNYDRHLVMTEVYGATANMPLENLYKEVMDQAVKGVNMFVPHAVWYDSKGKRTMPPDLSPRDSVFGPELPKYNEYVGRLHLLLQRPGPTVADIALLYPIESMQGTYSFGGPYRAYTGGAPSEEDNYMRLGEFLSFDLRRDFVYLHPETLQKKCSVVKENAENNCSAQATVLNRQKSFLAFPSPPFKGERVRVRGSDSGKCLALSQSVLFDFFKLSILTQVRPPHPNPLPPKGGRGECQTSLSMLQNDKSCSTSNQKGSETVLRLNNPVNPVEFRTILLPSMKFIGVETLRKIRDFYRAGGNVVVVGKLPVGAAESGKDAEVLSLLREIFGPEAVEQSQRSAEPGKPNPFTVEASSQWGPGGFPPEAAFDGDRTTRWNSLDRGGDGQWLQVTFPKPVEVARLVICEPFDRVERFQVQTFDAESNQWTDRYVGGRIDQRFECSFEPVIANRLRVVFHHPKSLSVSISEIDVYDSKGDSTLRFGKPMSTGKPNSFGGNAVVIHDDPVRPLIRTRGMLQHALNIRTPDVRFQNENELPPGSPTGSLTYMHRVIDGRDLYFFSNSTPETVKTAVELRGGEKTYSWWNPHDGRRRDVVSSPTLNGMTSVPLELGPAESIFLIRRRMP